MRQLSAMLKRIDTRHRRNLAVTASFHGIKLPVEGSSEPSTAPEMSEADVATMNRARAEAKLRKAQEAAKRHG